MVSHPNFDNWFRLTSQMKEQRMKEEEDEGNAFFDHLKANFCKECMNLGFEKDAVQKLAKKGVMSMDINFAFEFLTTQQKSKG